MLECLLVAGTGGGGEEVFLKDLVAEPPPGVRYQASWGPRDSPPGAKVRRTTQIAFNRLLHPFLWPLPGLRAFHLLEGFDLIHVHNHLFSFSPGARTPPIVMTVGGGGYPHYLREYLGWRARRVKGLYRRASRILPPLGIGNDIAASGKVAAIGVFSQFAADELCAMGVERKKLHVIPPGFPTPDEKAGARPSGAAGLTVLFVGRDPFRKGADLLIESIRLLRKEGMDVQAILVGDPSFEELQGEEGFEVHSWLQREDLYETVYPRADVLALPARAEGFGFVAIEAMSFGLPVLLSTQGAFGEILGESSGGIQVPTGEVRPLVDALRRLALDPGGRESMGTEARKRFLSAFSLDAHREGLKAMYLSVLNEGG